MSAPELLEITRTEGVSLVTGGGSPTTRRPAGRNQNASLGNHPPERS